MSSPFGKVNWKSHQGHGSKIGGKVIPHEFNFTIENYEDERVIAVNGSEIHNIESFGRLIHQDDGDFIRIDFENGQYLVLERKALEAVKQEIAVEYGLES